MGVWENGVAFATCSSISIMNEYMSERFFCRDPIRFDELGASCLALSTDSIVFEHVLVGFVWGFHWSDLVTN